jgi:hypothetical protein
VDLPICELPPEQGRHPVGFPPGDASRNRSLEELVTSRSRLFVALAFVAAAATATVFGVTAAQGDPTCDVNWAVAGSGSWGVASNWDTGAVPTLGQHACVDALSAATVVVDQSFNVAALDIAAPITLHVNGGGAFSSITFTVTGSVTNHGVIRLESSNGGYGSSLSAGTLGNAPDGTLEVKPGAGGPRTFTGALDNQGTLQIFGGTTLSLAGGTTNVNSGSIVVDAGAALVLSETAGTLHQTGGSMTNAGHIGVTSGTLKLDGGTIVGTPPQVFHGTLAFSASSPATGPVSVGGDSVLEGDIPAGITVWVQGGLGSGQTNLTSASGFTNRGALKLESINGAYQSHLTVTAGTFTNAGTLQINLGAGGSRTISAAIDNQATWNVADGIGLTVVGNPGGSGVTHLNSGSIVVGASGLLHLTDALDTLRQTAGSMTSNAGIVGVSNDGLIAVSGGRLKLDGGTIVGTPAQVFQGTLAFSASSPATGQVNVGGTSALQGDIPAGLAVWVKGGLGNAQGNLTSAAGFTNHGTLKLESINGGYQSHLTVTTGTFTNAGTLQSNQGAGGSRHLNASTIDNSGFIVLEGDAHLSTSLSPAPTITNQDGGTINKTGLAGTATLYLPVDNFGTITVGSGELHLQGGLVSYNATSRTLERGSYLLGGVLRFPGADVVTNNATLIFLGPPSALRSSAGADGLAGFAANGLSGRLDLYGRALNTVGAFTNAGTVTVNAGSSLVTTGNYTQTAGETSLTDAASTLTATASLVDIQGGALSGLGTVAPALRINGTVAPGESPGVLTVNGDYTQTAGGVMIADIAGILPADYDRLVVSGTATIDGTLELNTDPVYSPLMAAGTTHRVIAANALVGVFASVENVEPFANGRYFDIDYDRVAAAGVDLVVTEREVTLSGPTTVDEDLPGGNATYTLTLSAPSRFATTVAYTVDDVTTNAADHGAGVPASPITIAVGGTTATINVPITNDTTDEFDQAYAVTLATASNAIPVDPARVETTIVDDDLPPLVSVSGGGSVPEAAGPASFTLTLSEASEKPITVGYTVDDISTSGDDHGAATPDISPIAPGATTATVTVPVVNDTTDEPDQVMRLLLLGGTDVRLHPTAAQADATIVDEDLPPTVAVTAAPTPVNEAAGNATFTVSLSERSEKHLVVFYDVEDDTTSPADRGVATPSPVGINPGGLTGQITVPVVNDTTDEPDQAFRVRLTSGVDVQLHPDPAQLTRAVTITDNDNPPTVSVTVASTVAESAPDVTFSLTLSQPSEKPITVDYALEDGTATGADHGPASPASPVAIAVGTGGATITVPIVDDEIDDNDEAFGVRVTGGSNVTVGAPAAASVTIIDDDLTPIAVDGPVSTDEDTAAVVTLVATDADSPSLTYTVTTGPTHGTLGPVVGNQVTYTPDGNFNGTDSIRFTASDGANTSAEAVVAITVVAVNDAPVAANGSATVAEDSPGPVTLSGSDIDSGTLTYSVVIGPAHGTLVGTGALRTYTPAANYNGPDSFTFKTNDGSADSAPATVSLTVTPVNDVPVAVDDVFAVSVGASVDLAVTANDTDSDSSTLVATAAGSADHGVTSATGVATVHYTADAGYVGDDTFTYTVSDGAGGTANGTVLIHVGAAPAAQNGSTSTAEDTPVIVSLQASDPDGAPLTYSIVTGPTEGTLDPVAGNQVTYRPDPDFNGSDTFTFKANNGGWDSNVATMTITVTPVNDAPVATAGSATVARDSTVGITLAGTDIDGDALTYSIVAGPTQGTLTGTGTARTYTPAANYQGPDSFTFQANDGTSDSAPAAVTLTVTPVNDPPVASTVALTVSEGAAGTINFSASDVDGDTLTYAVVGGSGPASGSLTGSGAGRTFTAAMGTAGTVGFDYQACDPTTACSVAHATITVTRANRVSVASPQSLTATEGRSVDITLSGSDPDNGPSALVYAIDRQPNIGTLERLANDRYRYRAGGPGEASFDFTASDGAAVSTPATVRITVNAAAVPATPCTSLSLLPNPTSPHLPVGTTVTYTAHTTGCPNPVYSFWLQRPGDTWQVVAEGPASSYRLVTSGFAPGTYNFAAWVRNAGSTSVEAANAMPGLVLSNPVPTTCTNGVLTASPSSPHQTVGTNVTFTARTSQCPNPQYRFWLLEGSGSWRVVQDYGSSSTFALNTAGRTPGTYYVSMWARNAGSTAETETSAGGVGLTLSRPVPVACTNGVLTPNPSGVNQTVGTTISFQASAQCPNPQYKFWHLAPGDTWRVVQNYSSASTFALRTAGFATGDHYVSVWVRNAGSTSDTETSAGGVRVRLVRVGASAGSLRVSAADDALEIPPPVTEDDSPPAPLGENLSLVLPPISGTFSVVQLPPGSPGLGTGKLLPAAISGYRLVGADGGVYAFGDAKFLGSTGTVVLNRPIVGMADTPSRQGYWLVASDGGVFSFGDATFFGSTGAVQLNRPIVGMAATPSGKGYWLVASDGGVFSFGDATFFGSTGAVQLNRPIVGMTATPSGKGYWLVASDGGVFSFGDATFFGSTGAVQLNRPIVGMTATPSGKGYSLVASDGVFSFGDAKFFGSTGAVNLNSPIIGIAPARSGNGYLLVASDGGVFTFGDAGFHGSVGATALNRPVVGVAG